MLPVSCFFDYVQWQEPVCAGWLAGCQACFFHIVRHTSVQHVPLLCTIHAWHVTVCHRMMGCCPLAWYPNQQLVLKYELPHAYVRNATVCHAAHVLFMAVNHRFLHPMLVKDSPFVGESPPLNGGGTCCRTPHSSMARCMAAWLVPA